MISELWGFVSIRFVVTGAWFTYFIANDLLGLFVKKGWNSKPASIVGIVREVDLAQMGEFWVQGIWDRVLPRKVLLRGWESPSCARGLVLIDIQMAGLCIPCSPMCQCTEEKEIKSSRPLSFRVINVR